MQLKKYLLTITLLVIHGVFCQSAPVKVYNSPSIEGTWKVKCTKCFTKDKEGLVSFLADGTVLDKDQFFCRNLFFVPPFFPCDLTWQRLRNENIVKKKESGMRFKILVNDKRKNQMDFISDNKSYIAMMTGMEQKPFEGDFLVEKIENPAVPHE